MEKLQSCLDRSNFVMNLQGREGGSRINKHMNNVITCPLSEGNYCLNSGKNRIFLSDEKLVEFYKVIFNISNKRVKQKVDLQLPSLSACEVAANRSEYGCLRYIYK